MNRCKNCGAFEGTTPECLIIEATGPKFGKHVWQNTSRDGGAPGPEHWMNQGAPSRPAAPSNYLTQDRQQRGQLLDSYRPPQANPLLGQAPKPAGAYLSSVVNRALGRGWHETIIAECAPICRNLARLEPKKNPTRPADVRSRGLAVGPTV